MAWYSAFSGASCPGPHGLLPSNRMGPPIDRHWPLRFGYFASSNAWAPAIVVSSAAASARAPIKLRSCMAFPPGDLCTRLRTANGHARSRNRTEPKRNWLELVMPADGTAAVHSPSTENSARLAADSSAEITRIAGDAEERGEDSVPHRQDTGAQPVEDRRKGPGVRVPAFA